MKGEGSVGSRDKRKEVHWPLLRERPMLAAGPQAQEQAAWAES